MKGQDGYTRRVLHVTNSPLSLRYFLGGQVGYMRAQGFEVSIVCPDGDQLDQFCESEGVVHYCVPVRRAAAPVDDLVSAYRIWRVLRDVRPDIVHAHTPKGGVIGMLAAWLARVPVRVYHMRGLPLTTARGLRKVVLRLTEIVSCGLAHRVLCVSFSLRDTALAARLCRQSKMRVLLRGSGNGVDALGRFSPDRLDHGTRDYVRSTYGIPRQALVIGFVGRLVREKGAGELVEAWQTLREEFPDLHLLLVGAFESHDPVPRDVVRALHSSSAIHLAGQVLDASPLYPAMDVLCLPSYREGFPNVPLEAAAMRLPVVATAVPGCVDAVEDGSTGTLVPARDSRSLASALRAYLQDPDLRRRHGEAGRARVLRDFRQEAIWAAMHAEYLELLRKRGLESPEEQQDRTGRHSVWDVPAQEYAGAVPGEGRARREAPGPVGEGRADGPADS